MGWRRHRVCAQEGDLPIDDVGGATQKRADRGELSGVEPLQQRGEITPDVGKQFLTFAHATLHGPESLFAPVLWVLFPPHVAGLLESGDDARNGTAGETRNDGQIAAGQGAPFLQQVKALVVRRLWVSNCQFSR